MEYLTELFARITGSKIVLAAVIAPTIIEGACHWITITTKNSIHNLSTLLRLLAITSCIFLAVQGLWEILLFTLTIQSVGRYTVAPLFDLFWNHHHYGNPFQSFFLNKDRTLGPSRRRYVEEKFQLYDLDFQFNIPPNNLFPGQNRNIHGVTDESRTEEGKYFKEISGIREWRKYFWSAREERYSKQAQIFRNEYIKLSIFELELKNTLNPEKNFIQEIISELLLRHWYTNSIAEGSTYINSMEVNTPSIDGIHSLSVFLVFESNCSFELSLDLLIFQKTERKFIIFCTEDFGKDGRFILEQIIQSLKISPIPQEAALKAFSVDQSLRIEALNQMIRSTAQQVEEQIARETAREKELNERGWREIERILEQAEKDHREAENSNSD